MIGFTRDFVKLTTLLRNRGLRHAIGIALLTIRARLMSRADKAWERSIGLKFNKKICLDSLRIVSRNKTHGFSYVPCNWIAVRTLLDNIGTDLSRYCFIDFGSGEGRSLLVASTYNCDQVIGVEFAEELHQAAVRNIEMAQPAAAREGKLQSVHMDAALFDIPRRDCVLYFYNPFDEVVFQKVLTNIERVYRESGPKFYIVFHQTRAKLEADNTKNAELLRAAPFLKPCTIQIPTLWHRFLLGSQDLYIFEAIESTVGDLEIANHCANIGITSCTSSISTPVQQDSVVA
jgi:hypothetical protein